MKKTEVRNFRATSANVPRSFRTFERSLWNEFARQIPLCNHEVLGRRRFIQLVQLVAKKCHNQLLSAGEQRRLVRLLKQALSTQLLRVASKELTNG